MAAHQTGNRDDRLLFYSDLSMVALETCVPPYQRVSEVLTQLHQCHKTGTYWYLSSDVFQGLLIVKVSAPGGVAVDNFRLYWVNKID
eukprot:3949622-Amphidinium_carterae.1